MKHLLFTLACFAALLALSGCANGTQVSSLRSYNGPRLGGSDKCLVYTTSVESWFEEILKENSGNLLGDSYVSTDYNYEVIEAAYDCMAIGAKSVLVLQRGVVASSVGNSVSSNGMTTYDSRKTSGYTVAFFNKNFPDFGVLVTIDDYKNWLNENRMTYCEGCE